MSLVELLEKRTEDSPIAPLAPPRFAGQIITVWGSAGSGKTMLATNLAFQLAETSHSVALVDLDTRRPSVAASLGIVEPGAGITAIARLARQDRLESAEILRLGHEIKFQKHKVLFIPGLNQPSRFAEIGSHETTKILELLSSEYDYVVIDINDEHDIDQISLEAGAIRNQTQITAIEKSSLVLGVFNADQVGLNRFLLDCGKVEFSFWPIANRVRSSVLGRNPERQVKDAYHRAARAELKAVLVEDGAAVDQALQRAQPLLLAARGSKLTEGIRLLALDIIDWLAH
ncbi:MAG: hypothetical protein K9G13_07085 [Aquiluna sp.]|nr:hypothetical protein [Aquiluna sp.]MCF8546283.1 hypothetical protein [Aquiluna sp.]